jgi:hypothetical protein
MSNDILKKRRERFFLDRFLEHDGKTPTGIEKGTPPGPDFLIDIEGRKIGIELTELYIWKKSKAPPKWTKGPLPHQPEEPNPQAAETCTDQIVSKARTIYDDAGNPPVGVNIRFSSWITSDQITSKQVATIKRDDVAKLIADQVQGMCPQTGQRVIWRSVDEGSEDSPLSAAVASINASGVPEHSMSHWRIARAGFAKTRIQKYLQDAINEKAANIIEYKKAAGEIWLLIVADLTRPSQLFSVPRDFPLDSLFSPFERTIYFGYPDREVLEFVSMPGSAIVEANPGLS